jgi:Rha family phage regulatory protein
MSKKKKDETMLVTYNHDRQAILNEESWVYTDSLNLAKTIGTENKKVNEKIRQILKEYDLEDGTETRPSSEMEEFIHNNTDFTYSICYYTNSQNKLQPYYKLSKDLVIPLMFKFKGENAIKFQKLYIAKFNVMEKELDWYRCRYLGIVTRTSLTDAIKDQYEHEWDRRSSIYADFTDLEYTTLYGLRASQIRQLNSDKFEKKNGKLVGNVRPWLKDDDVKLVDDLEKEICVLIKYNMTYEQIRDMLDKKYKTIYHLSLADEKRE